MVELINRLAKEEIICTQEFIRNQQFEDTISTEIIASCELYSQVYGNDKEVLIIADIILRQLREAADISKSFCLQVMFKLPQDLKLACLKLLNMPDNIDLLKINSENEEKLYQVISDYKKTSQTIYPKNQI